MNFAQLSVRKPVLVTMLILAFIVIGAFSYLELSVDLFPEVEFPMITIQTVYPGAGPAEIENLITKKIEEEISTISGIKHMRSSSLENLSIIMVEFELEKDVDVAATDVRDKVNILIPELPEDAEDPSVLKFDIGALPVMSLAVSGPYPDEDLYRIADNVIKDELSRIEGVGQIDIVGKREREIVIGVNRDRLRAHNLSITQIVQAIAGENLELPSGHITELQKEYPIRVTGEFENINDLEDIHIYADNNPAVRLIDVADVTDTFAEQRERARYNNTKCIGISLIKRADANVVQVAADIESTLEQLRTRMPDGVNIDVAEDRSEFIEHAISELINNMGIGILLTAVLLFLFLHTWQGTVVAAIAMPTSIVATFTLFRFAGFTMNLMSLMGLAISIGVLVTNSIVVLENIIRHIQMGEDAATAAERGTREIALAVAASTLTNIVVFTPIAFMGGIIGQFFLQFGLAVTFATIFSLLVSFTLTPMLSAKFFQHTSGKSRVLDLLTVVSIIGLATIIITGAAVLAGKIILYDSWGLELILPLTAGLSLSLWIGYKLLHTSYDRLEYFRIYRILKVLILGIIGALGTGILFLILMTLFNTGAALVLCFLLGIIILANYRWSILQTFADWWDRMWEEFSRDYRRGLAWVLDHEVQFLSIVFFVFITVMSLGKFIGAEFITMGDQGRFSVNVEMPAGSTLEQTDKTLYLIESIIREQPEVVSVYTEAGRPGGWQAMYLRGVHVGNVKVELVSRFERDQSVKEFMERMRQALAVVPSADITMFEEGAGGGGEPDIQIEVTGPDLEILQEIAGQVEQITKNTNGATDVLSSWRLGVPEIKLIPDRQKLADHQLSVAEIALMMRTAIEGQVASEYRVGNEEYDIRVRYADTFTDHWEQIKAIRVKSGPSYIPLVDLVTITESRGPAVINRKNKKRLITIYATAANRSVGDIVTDIQNQTAQMDMPQGYGVFFAGQAESQAESFAELLKSFGLAIILTYIVLAAILESFIHPFTILMTVPLALIGVFIALIMSGKTFSIFSIMAIIMLVGIAVNNAILLIDYTRILRREGMDLKTALLNAGTTRLRAILMTNLATVISMIPLALELGEGSGIRSPIAIVSIGGLVSTTLLSLFVIPVLYHNIERIIAKR